MRHPRSVDLLKPAEANGFAGAVTLGPLIDDGMDRLELACSKCPRRGRYRLAGLIKKYGTNMELPRLRGIIAADCPRNEAASLHERCGAHYSNLKY